MNLHTYCYECGVIGDLIIDDRVKLNVIRFEQKIPLNTLFSQKRYGLGKKSALDYSDMLTERAVLEIFEHVHGTVEGMLLQKESTMHIAHGHNGEVFFMEVGQYNLKIWNP